MISRVHKSFTHSTVRIRDFLRIIKQSILPLKILIDTALILDRDTAPGFIITACGATEDSIVTDVITQTYLYVNYVTALSPDGHIPGPEWLNPLASSQQINYGMDPEIYEDPLYKDQMIDALLSIPTLSLVTDLNNLFDPESGIYVNASEHGRDWERYASLELLNPDGTEGFQINCGIRIRGGWSRHDDCPKRPFRIFFRSEYGDGKLKYPLFGDEGADSFDKIDIRTSLNYSWAYAGDSQNTFMRDVFSRDTQRDMGQPYTRSRFYHLYINGTYWGLYQTQERAEASYGETYFEGNAEDFDVIKVDVGENFNIYDIEATDGNTDAWRKIWNAGETGFSLDEDYFRMLGLNPDGTPNPSYPKLIDPDNLIDYMICTFFAGDFDGPISGFSGDRNPNNFFAIYNRVNPDGFKFFRHDAEHTMFFNDWGNDRTGPYSAGQYFPKSNPQWFHQKLSVNRHYRQRFGDRVYKHFFNDGALTLENNRKRIISRSNQIDKAIIAESARWGDSKSRTPFNKRKLGKRCRFYQYINF